MVLGGEPRDGSRGHGVRLPHAELWETQIEVLSDVPGLVVMFEVEADDVAVFLAGEGDHLRLGHMQPPYCVGLIRVLPRVEEERPQEADSTVQEPHRQGRNHPAGKLRPVPPACADVQHGNHVVRFAEEFVPRPADGPFRAEDDQERQEDHGDDAPDDVLLSDEMVPCLRLRLV